MLINEGLRFRPKNWLMGMIACGLIGLPALVSSQNVDRARTTTFLSGFTAYMRSGRSSATTRGAGVSALSVLPAAKAASVMEAYARSPLSFEPRGRSSVEFFARGQGYSPTLTAQEANLTQRQPTAHRSPLTRRRPITAREDEAPFQIQSPPVTLKMRLIGADPSSRAEPLDTLSGKRNYFRGADPSNWRANVPTYAKLRYREVYPGVDLVYYGAEQRLEYDFVVGPGADPGKVRLAFDGAKGMRIDDGGDLVLMTDLGEARQRRPVVYQETKTGRREIAGRYTLLGARQVGFEVGAYDPKLPLVIDPVIVYSTLLGGSGSDGALLITTD